MLEPFAIERSALQGRQVRVPGELDLAAGPEYSRGLELLNGQGSCVIDLSDCTFIDSNGIHLLVAARQKGARLVCPAGNLRRVFEIVAIDKSYRLFETLGEALAAAVPEPAG